MIEIGCDFNIKILTKLENIKIQLWILLKIN